MVSFTSFVALAVAAAVAVSAAPAAEIEERLVGDLQPLPSVASTYEYSLHASKSGKHIGSCHFATLLDFKQSYKAFGNAKEYKCSIPKRKCKSNGVGAKQAFIKQCVAHVGVYVPHKLN